MDPLAAFVNDSFRSRYGRGLEPQYESAEIVSLPARVESIW